MAAEPDPTRTLRRLWRSRPDGDGPRRGPRPGLDLDRVLDAAIELADAGGRAAVGIRPLAERLGVSRMTLYGYVSDKDELWELMVDQVYAELAASPGLGGGRAGWRSAAVQLCDRSVALFRRHPWLLDVSNDRPSLGPHATAVYEARLAIFDGSGLTDLELDQAVWLLVNFARGIARDQALSQQQAQGPTESTGADVAGRKGGESSARWWQERQEVLVELITSERFPRAVRVGSATGEADQTAYDPNRAYDFGLNRLLDGLEVLIGQRA